MFDTVALKLKGAIISGMLVCGTPNECIFYI
jgi:hypothetical protein